MTSFRYRSAFLALSLLFGMGEAAMAQESIEDQIEKLADRQYAVREATMRALTKACREKPELLDALYSVVIDGKGDIERRRNARQVITDAIFVERGAIGFALNRELIVLSLVPDGPAAKSGIQMKSQLLSVAGKSVAGKQPAEIYALVHQTVPGTKLEMEFLDHDGEKVLHYPEVAPRSTVRSDERPEQRRQQLYEEWMKRKQRELQTD